MSKIKSFGVNFKENPTTFLDSAAEEIRCRGYSILPNILSPDEVERARIALDRIYEIQVAELGAEKIKVLKEQDTARALLAYDELFLKIATTPSILALVRKILGSYVVLNQQNGVICHPNRDHHQASWHRDIPYLQLTSSRPLSISALFILDEFTQKSGATWLLPATHLCVDTLSVDYIEKNKIPATAPAGSVLVFDSMLLHCTGQNTGDFIRRALNHVFTVPMFAQQINLPKFLGGKYSDNPETRQLLGYDTEPAESVLAWRTKRYQRAIQGEISKAY